MVLALGPDPSPNRHPSSYPYPEPSQVLIYLNGVGRTWFPLATPTATARTEAPLPP